MSLSPRSYLVDGSLLAAADRRVAVKNRMVLTLLGAEAFGDREHARRTLYAHDFFALDIELLASEAMAEAADFAALTHAVANAVCAA